MKRLIVSFASLFIVSASPVLLAAEPAADAEVEARLQAARERLEQAAREVAELSAQLGGAVVDRLVLLGPGPRANLGIQLDRAAGGRGARIVAVSPGGPAAMAGLQPGDVIVALDGVEIGGGDDPAGQVVRRMREVEPESKLRVRVLRAGEPREFAVVARRAPPWTPGLPVGPGAPLPFEPEILPFTGTYHPLRTELAAMELASLSPELGRYFGTERGVLVVRAPESEVFRLEDGDVILAIDGREPQSGTHALRILRSYQPGEKLTLRLMRQRKPLELEIAVPEREPARVGGD